MKLFRILPLAIVLATSCAMGQDAILDRSPDSAGMRRCPIGLEVDHGSFFLQKKAEYGPGARGDVPLSGSVQRIHLTMSNPDLREILKLQFSVRGYSDKARTLSLQSASSAPDLSEEVTVVLDIKGNGQATSDLSLSSFTAVTAVDLNFVSYADGSAWKAPMRGACSVAPSLTMLVTADR